MDFFSHFLLPFAGALVALGLWRRTPQDPARLMLWRDRLALAIVFGAAGFAPDLDGLYDGLRHVGGLYFLQHRGFSHSLMGAPLHGLAVAGLVALMGRWFPKRLGWLRWRAAYIPAAVLGGFTHLLLDMLTFGGVPLWWPIGDQRVSLNLYGWLLIWMFPPAGIVTVLFLIGKMSPRRVVQVTAVLVALMVLNAGLRLQERPELAPGEQAFAQSSYRDWIVLTPEEGTEGWFVQVYRDGQPYGPQWYNISRIEPGSEAAVERAQQTAAYQGFMMNVFGPVVVETASLDEGSWEVSFTAVVPRLNALSGPRWTPTNPDVEAWGLLVLVVHEDRVETLEYGW